MASFNFISAFSHFLCAVLAELYSEHKGDGSLVIMEAKKRGEKSPRFCYVSVKMCCFLSKIFALKSPKNSVFIRLYGTFVCAQKITEYIIAQILLRIYGFR